MMKTTKNIRVAVLCLVLVHLLTLTCFAAEANVMEGVQVWTEGSLTPLVKKSNHLCQ